jgi:opacity protein-like surface antigen
MNKFLALLAVAVLLFSCKSKAIVTEATVPVTYLKASKIIANHYNNKSDFSTLYIKADAKYSDDRSSQNVTAEIKIKKDEQILVSIRFLGITMAKASITPTSVSYYEKIRGTYFDGDFSALSQWLGTDLDFNKIQNMLLGEALDDLSKGKYKESLVEQLYRLDDLANNNTKKTFYINAGNFSIQKQEITQTAEGRMIQVAYSDIKEYKETMLPGSVVINTFQPKGKSVIDLDYNNITFNEALSFPYSVPNGYNRIIIK